MLGPLGEHHSILNKNPQGGDLVTFRRISVSTPEVQRTEETTDSCILTLWLIKTSSKSFCWGPSDFLLRGSGTGKVLETVIYSCQGALWVLSLWIYWTTMNTNSASSKTKKQFTIMLLLASIRWMDEHPLDASGWQQNSFGSGFITWCGPMDQMYLLWVHFYCLWTQVYKEENQKHYWLTYSLTYLAQLWPHTSAKASQLQVKHHSLNTDGRGNLLTSGLEPVNAHRIYKFGINPSYANPILSCSNVANSAFLNMPVIWLEIIPLPQFHWERQTCLSVRVCVITCFCPSCQCIDGYSQPKDPKHAIIRDNYLWGMGGIK